MNTNFPEIDHSNMDTLDLAADNWQEQQEALREMFEQEARADQGADPDLDPEDEGDEDEGVAEDAVCGNAWGEDCPLDGDAESAFESIGWGSEDF